MPFFISFIFNEIFDSHVCIELIISSISEFSTNNPSILVFPFISLSAVIVSFILSNKYFKFKFPSSRNKNLSRYLTRISLFLIISFFLLNKLLLSFSIFAQDPAQTTQATEIEQSVTTEVAAPHVHTCSCGPTEHWFHKACVKNYNKLFPLVGLPENFDTEGLSTNILQAIEMLAQDICFVAQDGMAIVPELNAKGKLVLKVFSFNYRK